MIRRIIGEGTIARWAKIVGKAAPRKADVGDCRQFAECWIWNVRSLRAEADMTRKCRYFRLALFGHGTMSDLSPFCAS
jgi:hypothetical protein